MRFSKWSLLWIISVTLLWGSLVTVHAAKATVLTSILSDLESSDWVIRRDAVIALGDLGVDAIEALPVLEKLLYDDLWTIRDSAARSLGKVGVQAVPILINALDHDDDQTLLAVIKSLEKLGSEASEAVPELIQLLDEGNLSYTQPVIKALGAMGKAAEMAAGDVAVYLGHPDTMLRFTAIQTMAQISDCSPLNPLIGLILDPEKQLNQRMAGVRALEQLDFEKEDVLDNLNTILTASEESIRWVGVIVAGNIGSKTKFEVSNTIKILLELLDDKAWFVKNAALTALKKLGAKVQEKDSAMLEDALSAENSLQRFAAANLLAKVYTDSALDALEKRLELEDNEDTIIAIARALRIHGITEFNFLTRTDISHLLYSVRTEPAVSKLVDLLDKEAKTILEAQNMTKDEYISYKAWESSTTPDEMTTLYKGYQYEVDKNNVLHGAFKNSIDIRSQEGMYTLAYLYQEPLSSYYLNQFVLDSVLRSLDYMTRAQGSNGGFVDGGRDWPGVPNRSSAYDPVAGFTLYPMSRCMIILNELPAYQSALDQLIDSEGRGKPHIARKDAWLSMLERAAKWVTFEQKGHGPNQDVGCVVSAYTINEAHKLLHSENQGAVSEDDLEKLAKQCLSSVTWWTDQGMLKERNGQDPAGYDGHYGSVTQYWLGLLTMYNPIAVPRMEKYLDVLQYFYYPVDMSGGSKAYQIEGVTANRRQMEKGADIVALCMSHNYHPVMEHIYYATFEAMKIHPRLDFPGGSHTFSESLYKYVDFMKYGQLPQATECVTPAESPGPWIYLDPAARALVAKTETDKLVYVSLAGKSFSQPAPFHIVGETEGTFLLNPNRILDNEVVNSTQPYAYDLQFSPILDLENDAWNLIIDLLALSD